MSLSLAERASFRDPAGRVTERDGILTRTITPAFAPTFQAVAASGLLDELQRDHLLIPHTEGPAPADGGLELLPERIPFISYPYEWTPVQLRAAALLTLEIAERARVRGMVLRDASAYNIQFHRGRPILMDSLSFAPRVAGTPWLAYGQFCRHFLGPLALATLSNPELVRLAALYPDGVPLPVASQTLGWRGRFSPGVLVHLHLHAAAESRAGRTTPVAPPPLVPEQRLRQILEGLRSTIDALPQSTHQTAWLGYDGGSHYSDAARGAKTAFVAAAVEHARPRSLWDLGANTGELARQHAPKDGYALAADIDLGCVEQGYLAAAKAGLPVVSLWTDLLAPAPASGWAGEERASLLDRGPADLVLALALVHHLSISGRVPMTRIASWLARCARQTVVEVPEPEDALVQRLLTGSRSEGTYGGAPAFREAVQPYFDIAREATLPGIPRTLFHLKRRPA